MISDYFNQTVLLQSPIYTPDGYGQNIASWSSGVTIIGSIQGRSGNHPVIDGVQYVQKSYRLYCSSTVTITLQDRILHNSNYYYISYINNDLMYNNHLQVDLDLGRESRN